MGVDPSLPAIGEEELHVCHVNFPERQVVLLGQGDGEVINFVLQSPGMGGRNGMGGKMRK